jgi:hypothetical protein
MFTSGRSVNNVEWLDAYAQLLFMQKIDIRSYVTKSQKNTTVEFTCNYCHIVETGNESYRFPHRGMAAKRKNQDARTEMQNRKFSSAR